MSEIGSFALMLSLLVAAYSTVMAFVGIGRRRPDMIASAENGVLVTLSFLTVASAMLFQALAARDFNLEYVAHYTSRDLPLFYTLSAFWAGQSGSLLLWAWLLAFFAGIVVVQNKRQNRTLMPAVVGVLSGIILFFIVLMAFFSDPFQKLPFTPIDGQGLNPMLQNPGMIIHPPMLYLGYVGFAVPFAFAMAALIMRKLDEAWIRTTRSWTLFSWLALTLGNLFGAQWAYMELGWGGYWAWDPVENASLMPWLTGTAFLHSVMIQERRGMLKFWNVSLVVLTFALTIFGTFITRSGIISSVHSFGVSSLGPVFLLFLATTVSFAAWLIFSRRDMLQSKHRLQAFLSREASFLFNNLLLVGLAFATFWGTVFPLVSEALTGNKITVGPPFFNEVNMPIGLILLALTGICPLLAWRRSTRANLKRNFLLPASIGLLTGVVLLLVGVRHGYALLTFSLAAFVMATIAVEFAHGTRVRHKVAGESVPRALGGLVSRNQRRYGGYIVHAGVVLIFAGIAGAAFNLQVPARLLPGESVEAGDYVLTYEQPVRSQDRNKQVVAAELAISKEGQSLGYLKPERAFYPKHEQPVSEVAIRSSFWDDLYVVLTGMDENGTVFLQVFVNPLVGWIWVGGWVMVAGTLVAVWPMRRKKRAISTQEKTDRIKKKSLRAADVAASVLISLFASSAVFAIATVDDVAEELACSCGCGMTVSNCTHQSCGEAKKMKEEVALLLQQGHDKDEILKSFVGRYGEQVLAAPPKRGFNLTAWLLPFAAIGAGGLGLYGLIKRWSSESRAERNASTAGIDPQYAEQVRRELEQWKEGQ